MLDSSTDHLTGTWNRVHLERVPQSEPARTMTGRPPLSWIPFDIDRSKNINGAHGGAAGGSVLRKLAQRVRARVRASDPLFRRGGELFAGKPKLATDSPG